MAIIRWRETTDPFGDVYGLRRGLDKLIDSYMGRPGSLALYQGVFPALNIKEDGENLKLTAELPGVNIKDVDISANADSITLRGERKEPAVSKEVNYHQRERDFGTFRRVINLPVRIDTNKISASYKNGVLTVVLPKAEEAKPKQIAITAS